MRHQYLILLLFWGCSKSNHAPKQEPDIYIQVNVKDFGALGNGIANDTHAFELAMDKADSLKLPVYIPVGAYRVDITVSHDSLRIIGEKQPDENVNSGTVLLGKVNCNNKKNVTISNLGIDSRNQLGATDDAALTSGIGIDGGVLNQVFDHVSIIGDGYLAYKHGILCYTGTGITIKNIIISYFYHGIAIRSGNVNIDSVEAISCGFTSIVVKSAAGINAHTENVSINHVVIKGDPLNAYNRGGAVMVQSNDDGCKTNHVIIQNVNSTYGGVACILVQQVKGEISDVTIQNCTSYGQGDSIIRACYDIDGGSNIILSNCIANYSLGYGFRLTNNATNIRVINGYEKKSNIGAWTGQFTYLQLNGIEIIK